MSRHEPHNKEHLIKEHGMNTLSATNPSHLCILSSVLTVIGKNIDSTGEEITEIQAYTSTRGNIIYVSGNPGESKYVHLACCVLLDTIKSGPVNVKTIMEATRLLHIMFSRETDKAISKIPRYSEENKWLQSSRNGNLNGDWTTPQDIKAIKARLMPGSVAPPKKPGKAKGAPATDTPDENTLVIKLTEGQIAGVMATLDKLSDKNYPIEPIKKLTTLKKIITNDESESLVCISSTASHAEITLMMAAITGKGYDLSIKGNLGGKKRPCVACESWFSEFTAATGHVFNPTLADERDFSTVDSDNRSQGSAHDNWEPPTFANPGNDTAFNALKLQFATIALKSGKPMLGFN
jgi:hypothetical protein